MRPTIEASRRPPFNAGLALWERRDQVAAASDLLRRLIRLVGRPTDLTPYQWGQLFAAAVDFAPTVILELGRGLGNSTCVFTTAALAVDARVVSVCLSDSWRTVTRPRVAGVVPPSWLARLDARETDICALDFDAILGESPRVLVFWDAHGYQIAEHVLGRLLPAMAGREQLVLMHDISDVRYEGHRDLGYGGQGLWQATDFGGARVRLGHLDSAVEQAVAIVDFTSRNHLPLHSAAEDLHAVIGRHPSRVEALQTQLGDFFALQAHWFHFSPNERAGALGFPAAPRVTAPDPRPSAARPPLEVRLPAAATPPAIDMPAAADTAPPGPATTARPGPRLVSRARHRQTLDLVITGRSDDHGGPDFLERLCVAARHNHALLSAAGIPHTFTLVEWNPLPDRPLLSTAVTEALPFWGRCWVVDPAWHAALCENPRLRFMEFFAKNAAIRRSTADLVLTTNSDVFLSTALVERVADAPLLDEHVYRAVRHDVDRGVDWRHGGEAALADPRNHVRVNALSAPDYGNASGDFLLLTRATYSRLRGFNETVRYAKIHKDGQFCYRAFVEGLAFVPLGPIWHIDHEGSYANVGAQRGAPDMPYGPEWDWRQTYRNPASWGLAAAVEEPRGGQATHLHHPHTHGPVLSVVVAADRIPMAEAIGKATGRFLLINAPRDLAPDDERALWRVCEEQRLERAVFAGLSAEDPLLGPIPAPAAPFLIARDLLDRSGGWPELATDPALTWWLACAGRQVRILEWPSPRPPAAAAAGLRPTARLLALEHRGDGIPAGLWREAALECGELVPQTAALLAAWIGSLGLRADAAIGVCGPDWATPGLLTALERAGLGAAGLYTQATGQEGSLRWGARLKAFDCLVADAVTDLLAVGLEPAVLARLERAGFAGRTHQLLGASPAGLPPDLPSEMAHLRAALGAATARGEVAVAADVLTALATLAGAGRWDYTYDAGLGWDRIGRRDEAQRLFESVVAGDEVEPALRNRARFHAGRIACERGAHGVARAHLSALVAEVPDHGRAQAYLATLPAAPAAADGSGDA